MDHNPDFGDQRIAILNLRPNPKTGMLSDMPLKRANLGSDRVLRLFDSIPALIAKIPSEERFNTYYTACKAGFTGKYGSRQFIEQEIIPFDFDGVDIGKCNEYFQIFLAFTGLTAEDVVSIFTGNGLHFIVHLEKPFGREYFQIHRRQYVEICRKLEHLCQVKNLPIKMVDSSVFSPSRLLRLPGTENRKKGKESRMAVFLNKGLRPVKWDFTALSGLNPHDSGTEFFSSSDKYYPYIDTKGVLEGCLFLKHAKDDAKTLPEPEWYAMLSVVSRLEGGEQTCHDYSKDHPDYSFERAASKIEQAVRTSGPRTCSNIYSLWSGCRECRYHGKIKSPVNIRTPDFIHTKRTNFWNCRADKKGNVVPFKINYHDLVKEYDKDYRHVSIEGQKSIYRFMDGHWQGQAPERISEFIETVAKPGPDNKQCQEFQGLLFRTNVHPVDFINPEHKGLVNARNCVLDFESERLLPHDPVYGFPYILDYDANPEAQCPAWEEFIAEVTLGREELIMLLQEFLGYTVSFCDPALGEKALILFGEGSNGKGVFIDTARALIGRNNCTSRTLKDLAWSAQARYSLEHKMLNALEELGSFDEEMFKNLVSGGIISAKALWKNEITFKNRAKIIISCNKYPQASNYGHAFMRRILVVPFDRIWDRKTRNPWLRKELLTELPGILNWAMLGFKRLQENAFNFSESNVSKTASRKVILESEDPVVDFILYCIDITGVDNEVISAVDMFNKWTAYRYDVKVGNLYTRRQFGKQMKKVLTDMGMENIRVGVTSLKDKKGRYRSYRVWRGLKWKELQDEGIDEMAVGGGAKGHGER